MLFKETLACEMLLLCPDHPDSLVVSPATHCDGVQCAFRLTRSRTRARFVPLPFPNPRIFHNLRHPKVGRPSQNLPQTVRVSNCGLRKAEVEGAVDMLTRKAVSLHAHIEGVSCKSRQAPRAGPSVQQLMLRSWASAHCHRRQANVQGPAGWDHFEGS